MAIVATTLAARVVERNVLAYRRLWVAFVTGFGEPVFYLFSLGIGVGALVRTVTTDSGTQVPYAAFVAPALLATSAMNGAVFDSTYNVFFKMHYAHTYDAMLATPVGPRDVAVGEIAWTLIRGGIYAGGFLVVAALVGTVRSWWALLALPAALFVALAFAAIGMFATTFMRSFLDFDYIVLAIQPMFLFSATFFPLSTYPASVRWLVQATPLYHGVVLERALMLGEVDASLLGHLGYLGLLGAVGVIGTGRRLERLLLR